MVVYIGLHESSLVDGEGRRRGSVDATFAASENDVERRDRDHGEEYQEK